MSSLRLPGLSPFSGDRGLGLRALNRLVARSVDAFYRLADRVECNHRVPVPRRLFDDRADQAGGLAPRTTAARRLMDAVGHVAEARDTPDLLRGRRRRSRRTTKSIRRCPPDRLEIIRDVRNMAARANLTKPQRVQCVRARRRWDERCVCRQGMAVALALTCPVEERVCTRASRTRLVSTRNTHDCERHRGCGRADGEPGCPDIPLPTRRRRCDYFPVVPA